MRKIVAMLMMCLTAQAQAMVSGLDARQAKGADEIGDDRRV